MAFTRETSAAATNLPEGGKANRIMIVATSPVNRIVVSRIVERAGLKALSASPEEAAETVLRQRPALVIVDDAENASQPLVEAILARREAAETPMGAILIAKHSDEARPGDTHDCFDAIVAKPITPEMLQPVIERLLASGQATY